MSAPSARQATDVRLAGLTTIGLGGPARRLVDAVSDDQLVAAVGAAEADGEPLLVMAGGSNLVVSDGGFDGVVVRVATQGVATDSSGDSVRLVVAAGEPLDRLVERCVAGGLAGIECLSGIPGSVGATPIQNVGAYGQQVSDVIVSVRVYDRTEGRQLELTAADCGFGYRSSRLRGDDRFVVLGLTLELERTALARPLRYAQLAGAMGVEDGARPPLAEVREAVLALRRAKGMVVDPNDPDSVSAGSFFVNPTLSGEAFAALRARVGARLGDAARPPGWAQADGGIKTSAAWLIEQAGYHRGYGKGRVGISNKHTLALVNRGGADTAELIALAREVRGGVDEAFGVTLQPEPTLVGVTL